MQGGDQLIAEPQRRRWQRARATGNCSSEMMAPSFPASASAQAAPGVGATAQPAAMRKWTGLANLAGEVVDAAEETVTAGNVEEDPLWPRAGPPVSFLLQDDTGGPRLD